MAHSSTNWCTVSNTVLHSIQVTSTFRWFGLYLVDHETYVPLRSDKREIPAYFIAILLRTTLNQLLWIRSTLSRSICTCFRDDFLLAMAFWAVTQCWSIILMHPALPGLFQWGALWKVLQPGRIWYIVSCFVQQLHTTLLAIYNDLKSLQPFGNALPIYFWWCHY